MNQNTPFRNIRHLGHATCTKMRLCSQSYLDFGMGVREGKIRGAERNLPDFFGLCPRCEKTFSVETLQNCC